MPRKKVADSPSIEGPSRKQVDFSKAQGSSRNDESDLRDENRKIGRLMKVEEKKISNNHGRHSDGHAPPLLFFLRCRSLGPHDDSAAPPAGPGMTRLLHHCQKAEDRNLAPR